MKSYIQNDFNEEGDTKNSSLVLPKDSLPPTQHLKSEDLSMPIIIDRFLFA
jgi:hypothetical protein